MWRVLGAVGLTIILMTGVCLASPAEVVQSDATATQSRILGEKLDVLDDLFIIPFLHDADDPTGMTTLIAIQRTLPLPALPVAPDGQGEKAAETVTVKWYDTNFVQIGITKSYQIEQFGTQTVNSRIVGINFDPGGTGGLKQGFISVSRPSAEYFVDYIQVDFTNNFANGDVAFAQADGVCDWWRVRYMNGGPFAGGSEIWILVDNPLPNGQVSGSIDFYDEPGAYLGTYELDTGDHIYSLNIADIAPPFAVFGSMEVKINNGSSHHGLVRGSLTAGGLYSLAMNGVCIREQGP